MYVYIYTYNSVHILIIHIIYIYIHVYIPIVKWIHGVVEHDGDLSIHGPNQLEKDIIAFNYSWRDSHIEIFLGIDILNKFSSSICDAPVLTMAHWRYLQSMPHRGVWAWLWAQASLMFAAKDVSRETNFYPATHRRFPEIRWSRMDGQ